MSFGGFRFVGTLPNCANKERLGAKIKVDCFSLPPAG